MQLTPEKDYETAAELISAAKARGLDVTPRQLARWQTQGLLPRPQQIHRPGQLGSVAAFPIGTTEQFLVLCIVSLAHRKTADRGWYLWHLGYAVSDKYWKPIFSKTARDKDRYLKHISTNDSNDGHDPNDISEMASEKIEEFVKKDVHHPLAGPIKRKLGAERMTSFMTTTIQVALGFFQPWNNETNTWHPHFVREREIHFKALSLDEPRDQQFYGGFMNGVANQFATTNFTKLLNSIGWDQLQLIAKEFATFSGLGTRLGEQAGTKKTKIAKNAAKKDPTKSEQAVLILGWILAREYPPLKLKIEQLMAQIDVNSADETPKL